MNEIYFVNEEGQASSRFTLSVVPSLGDGVELSTGSYLVVHRAMELVVPKSTAIVKTLKPVAAPDPVAVWYIYLKAITRGGADASVQ